MAGRARHLRIFRELALVAQGAPELGGLFHRICHIVASGFGFRRVVLSRFDEQSGTIEHVAWYGIDDEVITALSRKIEDWPLHLQATAQKGPLYVRDVSETEVSQEDAERLGITSALVLPLRSLGRCIGFVAADRSGETFELDDETVAELDAVAALAATLVEKAFVHEEMERLNTVKDQFVSLVSHELRTPAAVIHGVATTLHLRGEELSEDQRVELRSVLYSQTTRLSQLVEQLLDLSRLDAAALRVRPEPVSVRTRVEELVLLLGAPDARAVTVDIAPDLEVLIDAAAFDRITSNLIVNAVRYGEPPVVVSAEQRDRHFRLSVEDEGPGVDTEFEPSLFERFTRGGGGEGSGLGLAIARSYARAHGGDLSYVRRSRGSRFELVVPLVVERFG